MKQIFFFLFSILTSIGIYAQNRVGIGITTPVNRLHIHDSINSDIGISITSAATGNAISDGLRIRTNSNNASISNNENGSIFLATSNGSFGLLVNSNYTTGLNSLNPVSDFHINKYTTAATKLKLTNLATGELVTDGLDFSMDQFGNASIMNNENELLGIGTTNPGAHLHVHSANNNTGLRVTSDYGSAGLLLWRKNDSAENLIQFGNNNSFIDWSIKEKYNSANLAIYNNQTLNEVMTFDQTTNSVGINNTTPDNVYSLDVKNPFGNNGIKSQGSAYGVAGTADSSGEIVAFLALPSSGVYGTSNGTFLTNGVYGLMNNNACTNCNAILGQAFNGNTAIKAEATGLNSTALDVAGSVRVSGTASNRFAQILTQTVNSASIDIPGGFSNNPNDIILVTHQYIGQYIPSAIGVWWDSFNNKWILYREDNVTIAIGEKFNVIVIKN